MNATYRWPFFIVLLMCYGFLFAQQEHFFSEVDQQLSHPTPPKVQKAALGYLRQLGGEIQFIKASVFYGGLKPGSDPMGYAEPLARHFTAATTLHPHFIDTYFLCQAVLPYINDEYTRYANTILAQGIAALPENIVLPFFAGFNHFYFLDEPTEAARLFHLAAQRPNAPPILEHLATLLSAEGGNIYAALLGLRGMYATEKDERRKLVYKKEIVVFEKAVTVLNAIHRYEQMNGKPPEQLKDLTPSQLPAIPDIGPLFKLEWRSPHLRVVRIIKRPAPRTVSGQ